MTHPVLLGIADELRCQLDLLQEQQERVDSLKDTLLSAMIAAGPDCPNTLKTEWGQCQKVTKVVWEYRDRGVTEQARAVDRLKIGLSAAQKLLKGLEDAAKASGKAKVAEESVSLRVVRGSKG